MRPQPLSARLPDPAGARPAPAWLDRARAHLEAHWSRNVALDELARVAGVTRFHLSRRFAQAFGCPPHHYQTRLRVARACELLRSGAGVGEARARLRLRRRQPPVAALQAGDGRHPRPLRPGAYADFVGARPA